MDALLEPAAGKESWELEDPAMMKKHQGGSPRFNAGKFVAKENRKVEGNK